MAGLAVIQRTVACDVQAETWSDADDIVILLMPEAGAHREPIRRP